MTEADLTVAVTRPTGTFGFGLIPVLQGDDRVRRIVGIARRAFDPAVYGWTKMAYRRGDVRDPDALRDAFSHADVVVHLAFLVTGAASSEAIRSVNLDGTLNAFRAAAAAGVLCFVYASSVAAYGFHPDNPVGMTEEWPVRPSARLFYARQKAELEPLLRAEAALAGGPALYLPRPPIVLGRHAIGAKDLLPAPLAPLSRALAGRVRRFPLPVPVLVPLRVGPAHLAARAVAALPFLPSAAQWVEAASHPVIVDTTRAREELGWSPRFTALEALRDTVRRGLRPARSVPGG